VASAPFHPLDDLPPLAALPLSLRAIRDVGATAPGEVTWSAVPTIPDAVAAAVDQAWGLTIRTDDERGAVPLPSLAAVLAQARAEQIVRALAQRTNLVLPGSRTVVVGDGVLADAAERILSRGGARVLRAAADPATRVRRLLAGAESLDPDPTRWPVVDHVVATGEGHDALDPALLRGVVIDASYSRTAVRPHAGEPVRAHVAEVAPGRWVVEAPAPVEQDVGRLSGLAWHMVDAVVAASVVVAGGEAPVPADARFAQLVLA
jgi:hypothetical protein